jgi:hypothetical protein
MGTVTGSSPTADTSLVETYWEGRLPEPVSPELALVDPVLREKLRLQSLTAAGGLGERRAEAIGQLLVFPSPLVHASAPRASATRREQMRRSDVIAWTLVAMSCATAFAVAVLAHARHPHRAPAAPLVRPVVAVIPTYTPSATTVEQLTEAEKRRLALLLRSPMRDPFSRASSNR